MLRLALALGVSDFLQLGGNMGVLNFAPGTQYRVTLNEFSVFSAPGSGYTYHDMLNISPGQPGYVDYIHWDITGSAGSQQNCVIRVFVDGEGTASINMDMAGLLSSGIAANGKWATKRVSFECNNGGSGEGTWTFRYPIPFKSSVQVQVGVSSDGLIDFWSDVGYRIGLPHLGYKLTNASGYQSFAGASLITCGTVAVDASVAIGSTTLNSASSNFTGVAAGTRIVVQGAGGGGGTGNSASCLFTTISSGSGTSCTLAAANASGAQVSGAPFKWTADHQTDGTTQFLNLASGSGIGVWHGMSFQTSTVPTNQGMTYLNNNLAWYLNGNTPLTNGGQSAGGNTADIDSSSTADYFMSGLTFSSSPSSPWQQNNSVAVSQATAASGTGKVTLGIDLWEAFGGISWTNGVLCQWEQGPRSGVPASFTSVAPSWNILYYIPYP